MRPILLVCQRSRSPHQQVGEFSLTEILFLDFRLSFDQVDRHRLAAARLDQRLRRFEIKVEADRLRLHLKPSVVQRHIVRILRLHIDALAERLIVDLRYHINIGYCERKLTPSSAEFLQNLRIERLRVNLLVGRAAEDLHLVALHLGVGRLPSVLHIGRKL